MTYIWARTIVRHRIDQSETIPLENGEVLDALSQLCARMDIPRPMILPKHRREWEQFGQTAFTRDHFVESVHFDRLELESYDPDARKNRSQDPRNA